MLTVTLVVAVFPATSVVGPTTTCLVPWVVSATGDEQDATPLNASEHEKLTVTLELFQPAASGGGLIVPEMVGGVMSRFTVTDVVAVFPAKSVAVPETTWFAPSMVTATGGGQNATPLVLSEHVKLTVTLELFHPAGLGSGLRLAVMIGGSLSTAISCAEIITPALQFSCTVLMFEH